MEYELCDDYDFCLEKNYGSSKRKNVIDYAAEKCEDIGSNFDVSEIGDGSSGSAQGEHSEADPKRACRQELHSIDRSIDRSIYVHISA